MFRENTKKDHRRGFKTSNQIKDINASICFPLGELKENANPRLTKRKSHKTSEFYKDLFENLGNPVFVVDTNSGLIIESNSRSTELYGYNKNELIGKSIYKLCIDPEDLKLKIHNLYNSSAQDRKSVV